MERPEERPGTSCRKTQTFHEKLSKLSDKFQNKLNGEWVNGLTKTLAEQRRSRNLAALPKVDVFLVST